MLMKGVFGCSGGDVAKVRCRNLLRLFRRRGRVGDGRSVGFDNGFDGMAGCGFGWGREAFRWVD